MKKTLILTLSILLFFICGASSTCFARELDQQAIVDAINTYISKNNYLAPPNSTITFKSSANQNIPRVDLPPSVSFEIIIPGDNIRSARSVILKLIDQGRILKTISYRGEFTISAPIVFAARDLKRGDVISNDDVSVRIADIKTCRAPIHSVQDAIGKEVKRNIRTNNSINASYLKAPDVIKRGELVSVQVLNGNLSISINAEARENGGIGETIKLLNRDTRKEFMAEIVSPGKLRISL